MQILHLEGAAWLRRFCWTITLVLRSFFRQRSFTRTKLIVFNFNACSLWVGRWAAHKLVIFDTTLVSIGTLWPTIYVCVFRDSEHTYMFQHLSSTKNVCQKDVLCICSNNNFLRGWRGERKELSISLLYHIWLQTWSHRITALGFHAPTNTNMFD
jgi:hypothetical protein